MVELHKHTRKEKDKALTGKVVQGYRNRLGRRGCPLSFAKFAHALNQPVHHLEIGVSYQAIKNWEDGVYTPNFFFIQQLINHAPPESWQHRFAQDILAVQWPEIYQPGSEIGEAARQR